MAGTRGKGKNKGTPENITQQENPNMDESTNNTPENATPEKDRKDAIRIANLKQVAELLGVGEARVRYLVSNDILKYDTVEMPDFAITLNVVKPEHIADYKARVESGETGSHGKHKDMQAYNLWIPESKVETVLALLQEHGCDVAEKKSRGKKDSDAAAAESTPSAENVQAEQERRDAVLESIG
jgi:hypothetical protein